MRRMLNFTIRGRNKAICFQIQIQIQTQITAVGYNLVEIDQEESDQRRQLRDARTVPPRYDTRGDFATAWTAPARTYDS